MSFVLVKRPVLQLQLSVIISESQNNANLQIQTNSNFFFWNRDFPRNVKKYNLG